MLGQYRKRVPFVFQIQQTECGLCCVCMISSPQGIENVFKEFPAITLIVAAVDSHLNERGYIVPGMGDAGDRIYNT